MQDTNTRSRFMASWLLTWLGLAASTSAQTLPQAVRQMLAQYPVIAAAQARQQAADADVSRARGPHWPQLSWTHSHNRYHVSPLPDQSVSSPMMTLNLWSGYKIQSDVERSQALALARGHQTRISRDDVALQGTENYLNWASQREQVQLAQHNLDAHQRILDDFLAITRVDPGRRIDLHQALVRHDNARLMLTQKQADLHTAEVRLRRLLMDGLPAQPTGLDELPMQVAATADEAWSRVGDDHPQLAQWDAQVQAAKATVAYARAMHSPTLQLTHGKQTYLGAPQGVYVTQLILNVPIWEGGSTQASVSAAEFNLKASEFDLQDARLAVQENLYSTWTQWQNALTRQRLGAEQVQTAQALVDGYWMQFRVGRRSLLELLNVQSDYFSYQSSQANARHESLLGQARVLAAQGRLAAGFDQLPMASDDRHPPVASLGIQP